MNNRERLGVILQLFGLRHLERRLFRIEVGMAESRERTRIRLLSAVIPTVVWTTVLVYIAAVVARTMRSLPPHDVAPPQEQRSDVLVTAGTTAPAAAL